MYKLVITSPAQQDIIEILDYYELKVPHKVSDFLENLDVSMQSIKMNPEKMQLRFANVRFMPIEKFEYSIHYYLDKLKNTVVITAVLHHKRNPSLWDKRK